MSERERRVCEDVCVCVRVCVCMSERETRVCEGVCEYGPKHTKRVFKNGTLANALFPMVRRALRVCLFSATRCVFLAFFLDALKRWTILNFLAQGAEAHRSSMSHSAQAGCARSSAS